MTPEAPGIRYREEDVAVLSDVQDRYFWFTARTALLCWALERWVDVRRPGAFLEIGCGAGAFLATLEHRYPALALTGTEGTEAGLEATRRRVARAEVSREDARELTYDAAFDAAGAFDVIEHIVEDEAVLARLHRALRPGGVLLLTVPQHMWLWSRWDDHGGHVRRYSRAELMAKVRRAGFEPLRASSFVSLLLPLMALSRLRQAKQETTPPMGEYALPELLNRVFSVVMTLERALIRLGLSFPWGGSLLLVARKPHPPGAA